MSTANPLPAASIFTVRSNLDSRDLLPIEPPTKPGIYAYLANDQGVEQVALCVVIDNDGNTIYGTIKRNPDGSHFSTQPPPGQFYDYVEQKEQRP